MDHEGVTISRRHSPGVSRTMAMLALVALLFLAAILSGCALLADPTASDEADGNVQMAPYATPMPGSEAYSSTDQRTDGAVAPQADGVSPEELKVAVPPGTLGAGVDAATIPTEDRLVIRRVDMRLRVDIINAAVDAIRTAVDKHKGSVIDLNVSTDEGAPVFRYAETQLDGVPLSGYLTVRIPAASLDAFLDDIAGVGTVLREVENRNDVTQEHVDLSARLKNLQASEAQLRDFLAKAKNVTEMLSVERELSRVRGEIEAMQAQIAYLERQAAHSTVTIELTGPKPIVRPTGEDWGFVTALTESVRGFVRTVNWIIVMAGALTPLIIVLAIALIAIRVLLRRAQRNRESTATEAVPPESPSNADGTG